MARAILAMLACLVGVAAPVAWAAPGRLTDAAARAFVAQQERAWNRRDLDGYFAAYTPDAVFVDQTRTPQGAVIRYGDSDLKTAKALSKRALARTRVAERNAVDRVTVSADGASARVQGHKTTRLISAGREQTLCAQTDQTLVWRGGRVRSRGQTDTTTRCRDAGRPATR